jgi:hypothetical protein
MVMASSLGEVFYMLNHIEEALTLHERAWQFAESKGIGAFGLSAGQHPEGGIRDANLVAHLVHRGAELGLFEREGDVVFGELQLLHDMTSRTEGRKSCRKLHF